MKTPRTLCKADAHEWMVFSTAAGDDTSASALRVECAQCGALGTIENFSLQEWKDAFHAFGRPYRWDDWQRVKVRKMGDGEPHYVERGTKPDKTN